MWWMLVALGMLSTFAPASGSVEGMIYTPVPVLSQLQGWIEVVPQALLLSAPLCYWVNHPDKRWLNWLLGIVFSSPWRSRCSDCWSAADRVFPPGRSHLRQSC